MVRCELNNESCCISCMCCGAEILKVIGEIKGGIDSFGYDGIEYIPISTVDYWINRIIRRINDD